MSDKQNSIERNKCRDFLYFLRYCKIVEAPTLDNPGGVIEFKLWPHLLKGIKALLNEKLISVLKSRQIGWSYLLAAYSLWYALFHRGGRVMLFSKGKDEAAELLDKSKRMYNHLPDFLKLKIDPSSTVEMGFPSQESSIKALPATETAGISYTSSVVICDEHDEHPYADMNYMSSKPTRDQGGQFISVFTANPDPGTLAKALFQDALSGKNDFVPMFFEYNVRPGREGSWYEDTKRNIPERELATLTPELYMHKNYPRTIQEALSAPSSITVFDHEMLDQMIGDTKNAVKIDDIDNNIIKVYKPFQIGQFYIASCDASHGVGKDFAVAGIMNVRTGTIVADIMRRDLPPEELGYHFFKLLKLYKNPLCYPEDNEWGMVVITTLKELGYTHFGCQEDKQGKPDKTKPGFHTGEKTRFALWGGLIPAINNGQITICNKEGIKQFYDVIRNPKKNGKIEAPPPKHDDYPMMVGICWAKKDKVSIAIEPMKPIDSLHFGRY